MNWPLIGIVRSTGMIHPRCSFAVEESVVEGRVKFPEAEANCDGAIIVWTISLSVLIDSSA